MSYIQPMPQNNALQPLQTLKIIPKTSAFYTDDFIEGQVELTTSVQIIINDINIVLSTMEYWTAFSKEMNTNIMEKNNQVLVSLNLDVRRKLNINTNLVALKEGKYNFGFKFKIPMKVCSSFEFPSKEGNAYLRYVLTANIISPYVQGSCSIYTILKSRQIIEMNKQISFVAETSVHKFFLFNGGKTKMTITSINGTDNFKFDENINFNINIDNSKGKLHAIKCKIVLKRIVTFRAKTSEIRKTFNDELISKEVKTDTLAGENKSFDINLNLGEIDNKNFEIAKAGIPYENIGNINYFLTSIKSALLECNYNIKFTLYFDTFVKYDDRPRIITNIILCHQTIDEYKNEENQKLNINNNINNISQDNNGISYSNIPQNNNMIPMVNNSSIPTTLSKRVMTLQMRSEPPDDQFNKINDNMNKININNNINNNVIEEDLPSQEEIEDNKFDKPNFNNNYGNNTFGNNYNNNQFDKPNFNNNNYNNYGNNTFGNNYNNNKFDNNNNINNYENNTFGNQINDSNNFNNTNKNEIDENTEDSNPPPLPSFSQNNNEYPEKPS